MKSSDDTLLFHLLFELKSMAYMNVANLHIILFKIILKCICWKSKLRDIVNIECLPFARWSATDLDTIQVLQVLLSLLNQHNKKQTTLSLLPKIHEAFSLIYSSAFHIYVHTYSPRNILFSQLACKPSRKNLAWSEHLISEPI